MSECPGEDALLAWCEGRLSSAEVASVEAHAAACARCRRTRVELAVLEQTAVREGRGEAWGGLLPPGTPLGRYVVQEWLGEGGMGRVYAAHDPVLNRKVAVKLIHPWRTEDSAAARERLLAEAQALARVVHPNLVAAFDAAAHEDCVFLAMELVDGQTLRGWLSSAPRTAREVLDLFLQAGAGLAAAHRAGLIHRDFKPENVLVGVDGRARVADLGLALAPFGAPAGTPAYMAPEQLEGGPLDARVDQFSFCVALHEALSQERPGVKPSRGILKAIARGRAAAREDRFPDMEALLAELTPRPNRLRRVAAAVALATLTLGLGLSYGRWRPSGLCESGPARLAAVWSPQRAEQLQRHFEGLGVPLAARSGQLLIEQLSAYGARWTARYRDACEATRVWGHQSDAVLAARMQCLQRRLVEVDAVAAAALSTDAKSALSAAEASSGLSPLQACDATASLLAENPPPENPEQAHALEKLETVLARAKALDDLGRFKEALALAEQVQGGAKALKHGATLARATLLRGELQNDDGDATASELTLKEAYLLASESKEDRALTRAALALSMVTGSHLSRLEDGERWAWLAHAALLRVGGAGDLAAALANQEGNLKFDRGDFQGATALYEQALTGWRGLHGDKDASCGVALANLARTQQALGQLEAGLASVREAVAVFAAALGEGHPKTAHARLALGVALQNLQHHEEALQQLQEALEALAPLGAAHPLVARVTLAQADPLLSLKRPKEALRAAATALEMFKRLKEDLMVGESLITIAGTQAALHDVPAALATLDESVALNARTLGPDHVQVSDAHATAGYILLEARRPLEALRRFQQGLALVERRGELDGPAHAFALSGVGQALVALGRHAEAVPPLIRARAYLRTAELPDLLRATESALAQNSGRRARR